MYNAPGGVENPGDDLASILCLPYSRVMIGLRFIFFFTVILIALLGVLVLVRPLLVAVVGARPLVFLAGAPFFFAGAGFILSAVMLYSLNSSPAGRTPYLLAFGSAYWLLSGLINLTGIMGINLELTVEHVSLIGLIAKGQAAGFMRAVVAIAISMVWLFLSFGGIRRWVLVAGGLVTTVLAVINFLSVGFNVSPIVQLLLGIGFLSLGSEEIRQRRSSEYSGYSGAA